MIPTSINLSKFLLDFFGNQMEIVGSLTMHFLGHHMNKLQFFKVLEIDAPKIRWIRLS